jgi:hypothetical protein
MAPGLQPTRFSSVWSSRASAGGDVGGGAAEAGDCRFSSSMRASASRS